MAGPASAAPAIDDGFGGAPGAQGPSSGTTGSAASAAAAIVDPFGGAPAPEDAPGDPGAGPEVDPAAGAEPTIQYDETLAHEADRQAFVPGGKVTVPYTPRADDGWTVDGASPRTLPAGNATGARMADARQGSLWTGRPPADLADPHGRGHGRRSSGRPGRVDDRPAGRPGRPPGRR